MSSYNNIEKIKYSKSPDDLVALQEYIVFEDSRAQEKYVVFKFMNNLNQRLHELKFEVMQYSADGEILEKSVVVHNNFIAESNSPFVPNAKLQVNYACKSISVNLIFAAFDRVKWEYGEFSDNTFKFERYANMLAPASAAQPAPANIRSAKPAKTKKKKNKKNTVFSVKDISNRNIAVAPIVVNVILCLLIVALVVTSLILFKDKSDKVYVDGFSLLIVEREKIEIDNKEQEIITADVIGYDGLEKDITVSTQIGKYYVGKIRKDAFNNSDITSVTFTTQNYLRIEKEAFKNCNFLTSVSSGPECGAIEIMSEAFINCSAVTEVNLPTADLCENSFDGSVNIKTLAFNGLIANDTFPLINVFGGVDTKLEITTLTVNLGHITADFLDNTLVHNFNFNTDSLIDYGALANVAYLANRYVKTDYCEIVGGEILSVNVIDGMFEVPKGVGVFNTAKFSSQLSRVTSLNIQTTSSDELVLDEELFEPFRNVKTLELADSKVDISKPLNYLPSLTTFIAPISDEPLAFFVQGTNINSIGITGTGSVTAYYLQGLNRISSINIAETVEWVDPDAFQYTNLTQLSIPVYPFYDTLAGYYTSGLSNLTYVEIKPYGMNSVIPDNFFVGLPMLSEINIANGFTDCGKNIVSGQLALRELAFPAGINFGSYPVIGENCFYLNTVDVTFKYDVPENYGNFNLSSQFTQNLSVTYGGSLPEGFFDESCNNLSSLTLSTSALYDIDKGLLKNCNNLNYLKLQADEIKIGLADLFGAEEGELIKISTLVIENNNVTDEFSENFFKGNFVFNEVTLNGEKYEF